MTSAVDRRRHWDRVFEERGPTGVSWYERSPRMSLEMIGLTGAGPKEAVLDVGGGASSLAGALLARGFADVTVLDLSEIALRTARARLGPVGARVRWVHADVLDWIPGRTYGLWHDRAVFHFLIDAEDRERYVATARSAVRPGGHVVIGTFAEEGPTTCSGLPVARYDAAGPRGRLRRRVRPRRLSSPRAPHPGGSVQSFTWVAMRRR